MASRACECPHSPHNRRNHNRHQRVSCQRSFWLLYWLHSSKETAQAHPDIKLPCLKILPQSHQHLHSWQHGAMGFVLFHQQHSHLHLLCGRGATKTQMRMSRGNGVDTLTVRSGARLRTANKSAVSLGPVLGTISMSIPASIKTLTVSEAPARAAQCNGVPSS